MGGVIKLATEEIVATYAGGSAVVAWLPTALGGPATWIIAGIAGLTIAAGTIVYKILKKQSEIQKPKLTLNLDHDRILILYKRLTYLITLKYERYLKINHKKKTNELIIETKSDKEFKLLKGIKIRKIKHEPPPPDKFLNYEPPEIKKLKMNKFSIKLDGKLPEKKDSVERTKNFSITIQAKIPNQEIMAAEWAVRKKRANI